MQFCHQRAKFHDGKKSYRYCGKICAAAAAVQAGAPNEDKICLMCRKAEKQPRSHFCSKTCVEEAEKKGPAILEVPVGHVTFISGEPDVDVAEVAILTSRSRRPVQAVVETREAMSASTEGLQDPRAARIIREL